MRIINRLPKEALDILIRKSRVHLYKPIQIAEILFHHRIEEEWNLEDLESYRNISKRWRDEVSILLVGRRSTSSQKYQDNIFDDNAMPPDLLAELGKINKKGNGFIEAYIYKSLENRLLSVNKVYNYIGSSTVDNFSLKNLIGLFHVEPGLKRSIDKMYEILVYALFKTIIRYLKAQVILELENNDEKVLEDFQVFITMVLGIDAKKTKLILPAKLYRAGIANAADRGLDMWANFGPVIQVKHLSLTADIIEDITDSIKADRIVIVCVDAEKKSIKSLLQQVGWSERIQGIISFNDLDSWYTICLSNKYNNTLGSNLLLDLRKEFNIEFPSSREINPFMRNRGYNNVMIPSFWR